MHPERTLSVTAATGRGVAGLAKDAERGEDIIVERHGRAVAAVISVEHFDELHRVRADLAAAALVLARELTDTGNASPRTTPSRPSGSTGLNSKPSSARTSPPAASDPARSTGLGLAVVHAEKQKHPEVPGCVVRLTDDAVEDLQELFKADPQIVRWTLKKMIQIERDSDAGDPLLGGLIGYRKITVGDRGWRVVWRIEQDEPGDYLVEIAEV